MNTTSNAVQMTNREFFQQRESAALRRIPGVMKLLGAYADQRSALEQKYPDAAFALEILSNPFVQDRELGSIRLDAYSAILNGEAIAGVHYKYDRQMDAYVAPAQLGLSPQQFDIANSVICKLFEAFTLKNE